MYQGSHHLSRHTLSDLRVQFESWRSSRSPGTRIPARLWRAATDAGRQYGVSKTALELSLDYYALKKRVESAVEESSASKPAEGGFLEIPLCAPSAPPECVLELEDGQGARLRVELKGAAVAELETLARAFWSVARCSK